MSTDTHFSAASRSVRIASLGALSADELLALCRLRPERYPVLLESAAYQAATGTQHDILMAFPGDSLQCVAGEALIGSHELNLPQASFLDALDAWWQRERIDVDTCHSPFTGGWFLYLSYELATQIEPALLPVMPIIPGQLLAQALRITAAIIRNSATGEAWFVAESDTDTANCLPLLQTDLKLVRTGEMQEGVFALSSLSEDAPELFIQAVLAAKKHIAAGDVYQANLSRGWRASLSSPAAPADIYRQLRRANPAPFASLARLNDDHAIISSSPERLLQVRDGVASTRPIAGTRPRAAHAAADAALLNELKAHPKERAEHIMLLDLERNDLGRICIGGSVRVDEYMSIESYAHVHHIVSNVEGRIRGDVTPGQALAALFPGGTITGCPKVRCMQIIAEQEGVARGAYTGSMGYLNRDGSMDLNILIRTLEMQGSELRFRAGAGIVADSIPERELDETRAKALGLLRALPVVQA